MELTGKTLGKYRVVEQIGSGGMATVYKAYQPGLDRFVALKVLPPEHSRTPGFRERFLGDARAVAQLSHPNILPVYDVGVEDGISYFAMKYVPGNTLKECLGKPLSFPFVLHCLDQVAAALDHAHERGIVHRDVKPANILVEGEWLYLTDFGVAKIMESSLVLTSTGEILGTPYYMSPEQASGKEVDLRSDVYSLGVVLFEMTTGTVPFKGETPMGVLYRHIHDPLPIPKKFRADIPESIEMVIFKAMAKSPAERFESAGKMAEALRNALARDLPDLEKDHVAGEICATDFGRSRQPRAQGTLWPEPYPTSDMPHADIQPQTLVPRVKSRRTYLMMATFLALIAGIAAFISYRKDLSSPGTASVQISTRPPGASVFVDDALAGQSPLLLKPKTGEHSFRVELAEFEPWEYRTLLENKGSYPFFVDLKPIIKLASLKVESVPFGAYVYVDGNLKGMTPVVLEVPFGVHSIKMAKPDFDDWEDVVQIGKSGEYPVQAQLRQLPKLASLEVDSNPSGAEVKVNGVRKGKTPTQRLELPIGEYQVELSLSGYNPREERVSIKETKSYSVVTYMEPLKPPQAAQLEQKPHQVEQTEPKERQEEPRLDAGKAAFKVDSIPQASLLVDNKYVGETPHELQLPSGTKHEIKLKRFGYEVWEDTVLIRGARPQTLTVPLTVQKQPSTIIIDAVDMDPKTIIQARLVESHHVEFHTTFTVLEGGSNKDVIARLNWTVLAGKKVIFKVRETEATCRPGRPCTQKYSHVADDWGFGDYTLRVEVEVGDKNAIKETFFRVVDKYASQ